MHTVFALLCFVVVIHWLIFPYPSDLLHWHCGHSTIAPVPAKQPWWIWINTSCEFIMNDCITTTKQSTTKPCAYFLGYTVYCQPYACTRTCIYEDFFIKQVSRVWTDNYISQLHLKGVMLQKHCLSSFQFTIINFIIIILAIHWTKISTVTAAIQCIIWLNFVHTKRAKITLKPFD